MYVHEEAHNTGHNDNEETNLDQDDYDPNMGGDTHANEDEEDDDGTYFFKIDFQCVQYWYVILMLFIVDEDLELDVVWLQGVIGQKDVEIRKL